MLDPKLIVLAAVVILIIAGLARLLRAKTQE
jgi:preprotein translocase subunit Sec61beta